MKRLFFAIAVLIFYNSALAQEGLNGETEIGTDGQHGEFFSQFLNYDGAKIGFVGRYFKVENVLEHGEFAVGPNVSTGALKAGLRFGYCTDHEVMTNLVISLSLSKTAIATYICEGKFSTNSNIPTTIYQKFFFPLIPRGNFLFRIENLLVNKEIDFLRIGAEYEYVLSQTSHFFIAPFYDPPFQNETEGKVGIQGGLRFL